MLKKNLGKAESLRDSLGRFVKGGRASPRTEFKKGEHWRPHAKFREKKYLEYEYITNTKSANEIALECGVTESTIYFWLKKLGVPRRTTSQARAVKYWGVSGKQNPMYGRCGAEHPHWIDGSTPERQRLYAKSFWKELARTIYKRDNYRCVRCGTTNTKSNRLHAHHIRPWAGNPDSRFDLNNIITVCQKCHNWIHSNKNINNEYLLP